jgi:hypothetical protein
LYKRKAILCCFLVCGLCDLKSVQYIFNLVEVMDLNQIYERFGTRGNFS